MIITYRLSIAELRDTPERRLDFIIDDFINGYTQSILDGEENIRAEQINVIITFVGKNNVIRSKYVICFYLCYDVATRAVVICKHIVFEYVENKLNVAKWRTKKNAQY